MVERKSVIQSSFAALSVDSNTRQGRAEKAAAGPSGVAATTPRGRSASGETARSQRRPTKHHRALGPACQPPLKECSLLGRLGQTNTDLAPSKAHVP